MGPSLSTFHLSLSLSPPPPPPSLCSPPVHHRYPCLLPASSVLSRRPVSFRLTRLGFYPLATCLSTRSLLKRRALGIRPPVWNALALMARALGPSEKRNIVLANQPLLSRNSACTSSIFSPASFIFPERSARARHFMSHNYCPPLHSILSYFTPSLTLRHRPTTRHSIFLQRLLSPPLFPEVFILENGTNIARLFSDR